MEKKAIALRVLMMILFSVNASMWLPIYLFYQSYLSSFRMGPSYILLVETIVWGINSIVLAEVATLSLENEINEKEIKIDK